MTTSATEMYGTATVATMKIWIICQIVELMKPSYSASYVSICARSLLNLFKMRPMGVMSKYKFTGACATVLIMLLNNRFDANQVNNCMKATLRLMVREITKHIPIASGAYM